MHNYDHKKLIEIITKLDALPAEQEKYAEWIKAEAHLAFLRENARSSELVVYANAEYTFVDSIVVPNEVLARMTPADLEGWHFSSDYSMASYVYGGGRDDVWIERGVRKGYDAENGTQLVFLRTFDGWDGSGRNHVEINQEYTHITGIHWRPQRRAYCRFDERGDLEAAVSVTTREDKGSEMALVTFKWQHLEEYLSVADAVLVRRYDFTLLRRDQFSGWPQEPPDNIRESPEFFYHRQVMPGHAAYTRRKANHSPAARQGTNPPEHQGELGQLEGGAKVRRIRSLRLAQQAHRDNLDGPRRDHQLFRREGQYAAVRAVSGVLPPGSSLQVQDGS